MAEKGIPACSDEEFIEAFQKWGATKMAKKMDLNVRAVFRRRARIEERTGCVLKPPQQNQSIARTVPRHHDAVHVNVDTGCVLIASDAHYWPGPASTGHRAFVQAIRTHKPGTVIMNGDVVDGASISRHAKIGWENDRPSLKQELEACTERLTEIEDACKGLGTNLIWTMGNHDIRFDTRLANDNPEYQDIRGLSLKDHFPKWQFSWSVYLNDHAKHGGVYVSHRFRGGMHAGQNNAMWSGRTVVCGHDHRLKSYKINDLNGTRYGVHGGFLGVPYTKPFNYTEDSPVDWCSGFVGLWFEEGRLLPPSLFEVVDEDAGLVASPGQPQLHAV
jgi:predicted phosphodiesterase